MDAATKNRQSKETIEIIARKAFGENAVIDEICEADGGFCNAVYMVTVNGTNTVLKIAPRHDMPMMSCERDMMETEVEVLCRIKDNTEVPVPSVLFSDFSCQQCDSPYFFMERVEGTPLIDLQDSMTDEKKRSLRVTLGGYAKQIHSIKGAGFGLYPKSCPKFDNWRDALLDIIRKLLDDGISNGTDLGCISYDKLWQLVVDKSAPLLEVQQPSLIHWDMWDGNIFVKDGRVSGIIDCERAMWADHLAEHDFSAFEPCIDDYMRGYGLSQPTKNERIRMMYGKLYRMLVMIIECRFRQYENDNQYNWVVGELKLWLEQFRALTGCA